MDIPFLKDKVYLDGAATQPISKHVADVINKCNTEYVINPNVDYNKKQNDDIYLAMENIGNFMGVDIDSLVFGKSTTELLNVVARSIDTILLPGEKIVIGDEEHNANYFPWHAYTIRYKMDNEIVILPYEDIPEYCSNHSVGIVSMAHTNNVSGNTNDIESICEKLPDDVFIIIDGCQHAPHVNSMTIPDNVNMYVFSGHKLHAPKGVAVAYIDDDLEDYLSAMNYGGSIDYEVIDNGMFSHVGRAAKHLSGTQNYNNIIAMSEAIDENKLIDHSNEYKTREYLVERLDKLDVTIYNKDIKSTTVVFNFNNIDSYTAMVGDIESEYGYVSENIYIREGQMCNVLTMNKYGIDSCLRVSISHYTTKNDIDKFIEVTKKIQG